MAQLNVKAFGLACGITWALGCLGLGICAKYFAWGISVVNGLGSLYIGYAPTVMGSLIGGAWALIDGFIGGIVIAFIYNKFAK